MLQCEILMLPVPYKRVYMEFIYKKQKTNSAGVQQGMGGAEKTYSPLCEEGIDRSSPSELARSRARVFADCWSLEPARRHGSEPSCLVCLDYA